jgi:predicted NAD/FAD-dependent oxidoreductase
MHERVDVVIVGAGVAGLAAAQRLTEAGATNGRPRGPRSHRRTNSHVRDDRTPIPIELGAEFVHGSAPELVEIARRQNLVVCDIQGERWSAERGKLKPIDDDEFWAQIERVMSGSIRNERPIDPSRSSSIANPAVSPSVRERQMTVSTSKVFTPRISRA